MTDKGVQLASRLRAEGKSFDYIAAMLNVGSSSVKRALHKREAARLASGLSTRGR